MDATQKRSFSPMISSEEYLSKRPRTESGVPMTQLSKKEKAFNDVVGVSASYVSRDAEGLAKILCAIAHIEDLHLETTKISGKYRDIEYCRTAISDISGLAETLLDAHDNKLYHSICSIGKCSPIN